jgi:hypothetical protein
MLLGYFKWKFDCTASKSDTSTFVYETVYPEFRLDETLSHLPWNSLHLSYHKYRVISLNMVMCHLIKWEWNYDKTPTKNGLNT